MANVHKTKEDAVNYLIEILEYPHGREIFRENLLREDEDSVLYILNYFVDSVTNNIIKDEND